MLVKPREVTPQFPVAVGECNNVVNYLFSAVLFAGCGSDLLNGRFTSFTLDQKCPAGSIGMVIETLLVIHIVVLGYWLGADLVINSTYRYACWARDMPFDERNRLMDHVMHVDQHVRYALVLQFCLGPSLASLNGYLPFGWVTVGVAALIAVAWVGLLELVYRRRYTSSGPLLDTIDLAVWICAGLLLLLASIVAAFGLLALPLWLTIKIALFGGVFFSGVGIRIALKGFFLAWQEVGEYGSSDARETAIRRGYVQATLVLLMLWVFIVAIVVLSIWQPS